MSTIHPGVCARRMLRTALICRRVWAQEGGPTQSRQVTKWLFYAHMHMLILLQTRQIEACKFPYVCTSTCVRLSLCICQRSNGNISKTDEVFVRNLQEGRTGAGGTRLPTHPKICCCNLENINRRQTSCYERRNRTSPNLKPRNKRKCGRTGVKFEHGIDKLSHRTEVELYS